MYPKSIIFYARDWIVFFFTKKYLYLVKQTALLFRFHFPVFYSNIIAFHLIDIYKLYYNICIVTDNSPNKILHFDHGKISVDPVQIPGDETIEVDMQILQNIDGHQHSLNLVIKKLGLLDLKVPCISNIGSW